MSALLASDDPQAMTDLHARAEAGNAAAVVALATASGWFPVGNTLAERNRLRRVGGVPVAEAAAALHPPLATWQDWPDIAIGGVAAVAASAAALAEAGEPLRAARGLDIWLNQAGAVEAVPEGFWTTLPVAPQSRALALSSRLSYHAMPQPDDRARLSEWLDTDRPEGWLVLHLVGRGPADSAAAGLARNLRTAAALGRSAPEIAAHEAVAAAFADLSRGGDPAAHGAEALHGVATALAAAGADLPLRLWCAGTCPGAEGGCAAAAIAAFGLWPAMTDHDAPMSAALPLAEFFASPRGGASVVAVGLAPRGFRRGDAATLSAAAASPAVARARAQDACFAAALDAALPALAEGRFAR